MTRRHSLISETLTSMARQRPGLDAGRCQAVLEFLGASALVRGALLQPLARVDLTELKFAILVSLFALDPCPTTPSDLASYTGATRTAVTDAVARLEVMKCIARARAPEDGRIVYLRLTAAGRTVVESAAVAYLQALGSVARLLDLPGCRALSQASGRLRAGAAAESAFLPS